MTREEKIIKRKLRASKRKEKHFKKYLEKINNVSEFPSSVPLYCGKIGNRRSWEDPNSETGYSQICSYQGICQAPCNGDC